jgi:hypothetical protein
MNGFVAILGREVFERRLLLLAAVVLGFIPLAAPLLPGMAHHDPGEIRAGTAFLFSLLFTGFLSLGLGGTVIARDLAEGRLGFYFSRPLSGGAVWAGKSLAAVLLALGSGLLILVPVTLLNGQLPGARQEVAQWIDTAFGVFFWVPLAVLFLVPLAHFGSVAVRSRSPWLALDLAAAGLVGLVGVAVSRNLLSQGAFDAGFRGTAGLVAVAWLALVGAGAAQVVRGRADLHRGHRLLSLGVWGPLVAATLLFAGYGAWVLGVKPADLDRVEGAASFPGTDWIVLTGEAPGRGDFRPAFLFEPASGRSVRLRTYGQVLNLPWTLPRVSGDGRRALWFEPVSGGPAVSVAILDLEAEAARPERPPLVFSSSPHVLALSHDGRRLAHLSGNRRNDRLIVESIDDGRLLASVPVPAWQGEASIHFLGPDSVRVILGAFTSRGKGFDLRIGELDLQEKELRTTVEAGPFPGFPQWQVSPEGDRLLLGQYSRGRLTLLDTRTGAVLGTSEGALHGTAFLAGGRIARIVRQKGSRELEILSPDLGSVVRRFRFPGVGSLMLGGEPGPGRLVVAGAPSGRSPLSEWRAWTLDLDTGDRRELGQGLVPARTFEPTGVARPLFLTDDGGLARVDPATGERHKVL